MRFPFERRRVVRAHRTIESNFAVRPHRLSHIRLALVMECPFKDPLPECPAVALRGLPLKAQMNAVEAMDEVTIDKLQEGMEAGKYTARSIVEMYLKRVEEIDKKGAYLVALLIHHPKVMNVLMPGVRV